MVSIHEGYKRLVWAKFINSGSIFVKSNRVSSVCGFTNNPPLFLVSLSSEYNFAASAKGILLSRILCLTVSIFLRASLIIDCDTSQEK